MQKITPGFICIRIVYQLWTSLGCPLIYKAVTRNQANHVYGQISSAYFESFCLKLKVVSVKARANRLQQIYFTEKPVSHQPLPEEKKKIGEGGCSTSLFEALSAVSWAQCEKQRAKKQKYASSRSVFYYFLRIVFSRASP